MVLVHVSDYTPCKYLPKTHPYRQVQQPFNGKVENKGAPIRMFTQQIMASADERMAWLVNPRNRARGNLDPIHKHGMKRRNIMFELPYWYIGASHEHP